MNVQITDYIYLNEDIIYDIMLYCPIYMIRKYIQTCKFANKILTNKLFWIKKFHKDGVSLLYYRYYNLYPINIYWIKEYMKCYKIKNNINILLEKNKLKNQCIISVKIAMYQDLSWLSTEYNYKINKQLNFHESLINESYKTILFIEYFENRAFINYIVYDDDGECFNVVLDIPFNQYNTYLELLMYYLVEHKFKLQ